MKIAKRLKGALYRASWIRTQFRIKYSIRDTFYIQHFTNIHYSRPKNSSHCLVSLSVSPCCFAGGSFSGLFRLSCFRISFQKTSDFNDVAFLARAAFRSLRSLLTTVKLLADVLVLILSSITVSVSVPKPANKTSRLLILSNPLLSRGPVPSKIISPFWPVSFKYLPIIRHNPTSLIGPESAPSLCIECNRL